MSPTAAVAVSPEYFGTLDVSVVNGRAFTEDDREGTIAVAMVNEWAARRWWPGKNPVGQVVRVDTAPGLAQSLSRSLEWCATTGGAANVLLADDGAELYRPRRRPAPFPTFRCRGRPHRRRSLRPVRQLQCARSPIAGLRHARCRTRWATSCVGVRTNATQILAFAAVGLLLAVLGLHGVLASQRGRHARSGFAALGTSRQRIAAMILRDALLVCGGGVAALVWPAAPRRCSPNCVRHAPQRSRRHGGGRRLRPPSLHCSPVGSPHAVPPRRSARCTAP
jgi:hypothetical protein